MEYQQDVVHLLIWACGILGGALVFVSLFVAKSLMASVEVLKKNDESLKTMLAQDLHAVRELFHGLDKRVLALEVAGRSRFQVQSD